MSGPERQEQEHQQRRFRKWWVVPALVALTTAGIPLAAGAGGGGTAHAEVAGSAAEDPTVAETRQLLDRFLELWNEKKFDELAVIYTEDAILLPPNHEPIRGRGAIVAYLKEIRDVAGEFDQGDHLIRGTPAGEAMSWVGQFSLRGGKVRITDHELWVRQPDGSMKLSVDMFGYRDPLS